MPPEKRSQDQAQAQLCGNRIHKKARPNLQAPPSHRDVWSDHRSASPPTPVQYKPTQTQPCISSGSTPAVPSGTPAAEAQPQPQTLAQAHPSQSPTADTTAAMRRHSSLLTLNSTLAPPKRRQMPWGCRSAMLQWEELYRDARLYPIRLRPDPCKPEYVSVAATDLMRCSTWACSFFKANPGDELDVVLPLIVQMSTMCKLVTSLYSGGLLLDDGAEEMLVLAHALQVCYVLMSIPNLKLHASLSHESSAGCAQHVWSLAHITRLNLASSQRNTC